MYALNAKTGAKLWTYPTYNNVNASPAVANGVVYAGTNNWYFFALNAKTGAPLWTFGTRYSAAPSPVTADGVLYVEDTGTYGLPATVYALGLE